MTTYLRSLFGEPILNQTYPHCDYRVLHSPGKCKYCDMHLNWQQDRIKEKMLFTDDPRNIDIIEKMLSTGINDSGFVVCPAVFARGNDCQIWPGNKPTND